MKQVKFIIKKDGNSSLYIDGVTHGVYSPDQVDLVKNVLNTLHVRDADMSKLIIEESE